MAVCKLHRGLILALFVALFGVLVVASSDPFESVPGVVDLGTILTVRAVAGTRQSWCS